MKQVMVSLALIGCLAAGHSAQAQDRAAARKACMPDFQKYCTGVAPGGGRVIQCLTANLDKLTPDCRAVVASTQGKAKGPQTNEPAGGAPAVK